MTEVDAELAHFFERRAALYEEVDRLRGSIDRWQQANLDGGDMGDLGRLEGLLTQKHEILQRMTDLEQSMVDYLISKRARPQFPSGIA